MAMKVRRIVTGHNAAGKAVIKTDEQIAAVPRIGAGISGAEIWSTDQMPIDNSAAADAAQRAGFVKHTNYVGDGAGTTFRINEWAPGPARFTHRTETLDYAIVLAGEIDCELENGEAVHLTSGDVMIQRGTIHTWVNKGSVPAVIAFILIDAKPVEVNGTEMRTVFPAPPKADHLSRRPACVPDTAHMEYIMSPSPVPQVRLATVATFPKNYFLEKLAVRAENSILVTALNHKELWYVPSSPDGAEVAPRLLFAFPHLAMGIVEAERDIFYIATSEIYSWSASHLYRLDLNGWTPGKPVNPESIRQIQHPVRGLNGS